MDETVHADLDWLTEEILASYDTEPRTRRIGERFLPTRSKIVEILAELRQLLFPGYFGHKQLTKENIRYHVGNLLARVAQDLSEQINHCICSERSCIDCLERDKCQRLAVQTARDFLAQIPTIRSALAMDAQAAYDGDPAAKSIDEIIYCYPGFYAVTVYRIAHELLKLDVPLMPRIMTEHAHGLTGADIHPGAAIGRSFFIDHATGVIIGETTTIGNNVKIYQGVTLGGMSFPKDERGRVIKGYKRHPTIEDDVTIYSNTTILGGDTVIGRGSTVNGNAFLTHSVTSETTVTHERPQLRVRKKATDKKATQ